MFIACITLTGLFTAPHTNWHDIPRVLTKIFSWKLSSMFTCFLGETTLVGLIIICCLKKNWSWKRRVEQILTKTDQGEGAKGKGASQNNMWTVPFFTSAICQRSNMIIRWGIMEMCTRECMYGIPVLIGYFLHARNLFYNRSNLFG